MPKKISGGLVLYEKDNQTTQNRLTSFSVI